MRAARIEQQGGPDVIQWSDADLPPPGPGEVRMRSTAIGLNYIDTYHRDGTYRIALPSGLGIEAAGIVVAVGEGVTAFGPGDRVCTMGPQLGAYATERNIHASALFAIPDDISDDTAAAGLLKGCTTEFLVERCPPVAAGESVLVHAAAGGVGLLLVQWLKHRGAIVIGTVSTPEKAELARKAGCDHVLFYKAEDVAARVRKLTGGAGVRVSYDGIGMKSWEVSLAATGRRGTIVSFGNAGGPVTGVDLSALAQAGSLFVTRPTLFDYYREETERQAGVRRVFDMFRTGALRVEIGQTYALADVAQAHRDLEAGRTVGATILTP